MHSLEERPFHILRDCDRAYPLLSREYGNFGNPRDFATETERQEERETKGRDVHANGPAGEKIPRLMTPDDFKLFTRMHTVIRGSCAFVKIMASSPLSCFLMNDY